MPSTEEAFGVAYIEAMAGGVPAIGCRGEAGPEEIAAAGDGFVLVPPGDIERLTQRIDELLSDPQRLREAGIRARETVAANFSWSAAASRPLPPTSTRLGFPRAHLGEPVDEISQQMPIGADALLPMKPVLFVTGHAPAYRVGAFERLHEHENVEFALFGGRLKHGGGSTADDLPFPHRHVREHALKSASELYALAASGRYRAVVCPTGGRVAPLATWAGARRARVPLILWASLWAHPRSAAHALSYPALRRLYRSADAVVTYGPHVSAYVRSHGAKRVHVAPQSVDNEFWGSPDVSLPNDPRWPANTEVTFLFAGRPTREKGLGVLVEAWSTSGLQAPTAALVLVGAGSTPPWVPAGGAVVGLDPVPQPSNCATSTLPPMFWWCRRFRRELSASRGGWW